MLSAVYEQFQILSDFYKSFELPNAAEVLETLRETLDRLLQSSSSHRPLAESGICWPARRPAAPGEGGDVYPANDHEADAPRLISSLWCYLGKSDGFTQEMFDIFAAGMSPVIWWSRGRFGSQHEALRSLALKMLRIPATSAAAERNWSAFRFIHTRLRNKLRSSRVQKLVYVFENTKPVNKDAPLDDGLDSLAAAFSDEE